MEITQTPKGITPNWLKFALCCTLAISVPLASCGGSDITISEPSGDDASAAQAGQSNTNSSQASNNSNQNTNTGSTSLSQADLAGTYSGKWSGVGSHPGGDDITITLSSTGQITGGIADIKDVGPVQMSGILKIGSSNSLTGKLVFSGNTPFKTVSVRAANATGGGKNISGKFQFDFKLNVSMVPGGNG